MNFILLGYIIAWIAIILIIAAIAGAMNEYSKLTPRQQEVVNRNGIDDATKHLVVLIISIVYIIVYHIS